MEAPELVFPRERIFPGACFHLVIVMTEHLAHQPNELQGARVADAIEYPVGILARGENAFIAQNGQMLRDIALRGADMIDDILDIHFLIAKNTQNLESQRMRHGFE